MPHSFLDNVRQRIWNWNSNQRYPLRRGGYHCLRKSDKKRQWWLYSHAHPLVQQLLASTLLPSVQGKGTICAPNAKDCENAKIGLKIVILLWNFLMSISMISWFPGSEVRINRSQTNEVITNSLFNLSHWLLFYFRKSQNASDNQRRCMSNWFV